VFLFVRRGHTETPALAVAPLLAPDQAGLAIGGRF
jgi:hypothetical protein